MGEGGTSELGGGCAEQTSRRRRGASRDRLHGVSTQTGSTAGRTGRRCGAQERAGRRTPARNMRGNARGNAECGCDGVVPEGTSLTNMEQPPIHCPAGAEWLAGVQRLRQPPEGACDRVLGGVGRAWTPAVTRRVVSVPFRFVASRRFLFERSTADDLAGGRSRWRRHPCNVSNIWLEDQASSAHEGHGGRLRIC